MDDSKTPVALLGSSGIVSQRFQQRLANHPWFRLEVVFGSSKNSGKLITDLQWHLKEEKPDLPKLTVISGEPSDLIFQLEKLNIKYVFSTLPTEEAATFERQLQAAGFTIFSNSATNRMADDVPLIIPDLNPEHLSLSDANTGQEKGRIYCSTNCTVMPVVLPLKPLHDKYNLQALTVTTNQSLSGGGINLMKTAAESGEVNKEIPGEAEKIAEEAITLLGELANNTVQPLACTTNIYCQRVMREYGHIVHVKACFENPLKEEQVIALLTNYRSEPQNLNLPSAPFHPLIVQSGKIDPELAIAAGCKDSENLNPAFNLILGMAIIISELNVTEREISFTAFSENTIRGAAGGCLLLAELVYSQDGLVKA